MKPSDQDIQYSFSHGAKVWIPDPHLVWRLAVVVSSNQSEKRRVVQFLDDSSSFELPQNATIYMANEKSFDDLDDLTQLPHLNEPSLLHCLAARFNQNIVYTYTGSILLAVNPFKLLPSLYSSSTLEAYFSIAHFHAPLTSHPPHVFGTAASAYSALCRLRKSQTVLVSGESGAGKTESTKFVMKFLSMAGTEDVSNFSSVENQVLQSNPLLESIGNAKTLRNANSSRFGKFIDMQFEPVAKHGSEFVRARLCGAQIQTYLLETVRVSQQMEGERNFHIFYQLCAAASYAKRHGTGHYEFPQLLKDPKAKPFTFDLALFKEMKQYRYLTKSTCFQLEGVDDLECFESTVLAMQTIGITPSDELSFFSTTGAVLSLGNLLFEPNVGDSESSKICDTCHSMLDDVASFLQLPSSDELHHALTHRSITAGREHYIKPLTVREAEDNRDALARALYGKLFCLVVDRVNESIGFSSSNTTMCCGVLDIFGFECFAYNSFEQLCINYTNERLQEFFNMFMFECEKELYIKEGIDWDVSDFPSNHDCVDLLERKPDGIFSLIHEECIVPKGNDRSLVNKMKKQHKNNSCFKDIQVKPEWFIINHFAGSVSYCIDGFVEKNKDSLSRFLAAAVLKSENPFILSLLSHYREESSDGKPTTRSRNTTTLSYVFRDQLRDLLNRIASTDPHFIRCIKPNSLNTPDILDREMITEQVRYGGVLQAVKVSRAGYPVRIQHLDFLIDYRFLAPPAIEKKIITSIKAQNCEFKELSVYFCDQLDKIIPLKHPETGQKLIAVGKTRIFMKQEFNNLINKKRSEIRKEKVAIIENVWMATLQRRYYVHLKACALIIQSRYRGYLARKLLRTRRITASCLKIQKVFRGIMARHEVAQMRESLTLLQSLMLSCLKREQALIDQKEQEKRHKMATRIQRYWRNRSRHTSSLSPKKNYATVQQVKKDFSAIPHVMEENRSLKNKLEEITAALEEMKREKDLLEMKLVKVHGSPSWNITSSQRLSFNDDVTCASSINGASPSSAEFSDNGKSPKSIEQVVQLNFSANRETFLQRTRASAVEFARTSHPDASLDHVEENSEETQDYLAWIQAKYATIHSRRNESDVSQGDVVNAVDGRHVGIIDILILGHYGAGVKDIVFHNVEHLTYCQKVQLNEGTLYLFSLEKYHRTWILGYVEISQQFNNVLHVDPSNVSFFLIQLLLSSEYVVLAYSSLCVESLRLLERLINASRLTKMNVDLCFWETTVPSSSDKPCQSLTEFSAIALHQGSLSSLLDLYCDKFKKTKKNASGERSDETELLEHEQGSQPLAEDHLSTTHEMNKTPEKSFNERLAQSKDDDTPWLESGSCNEKPREDVTLLKTTIKTSSCGVSSVGLVDGSLLMYRIFLTEKEKESSDTSTLSSKQSEWNDSKQLTGLSPTGAYPISLWKIEKAHEGPITTLAFSDTEINLFSSSTQDCSIRMWELETGVCRKNFQDTSPCTTFCLMPLYPSRFIIANTNAVLRVVDSTCGVILQRIHFSLCLTSLCFDDIGQLCFGGSADGTILVFSLIHPEGQLKLLLHICVANTKISSIRYSPTFNNIPSCLHVMTEDGVIKSLEFHDSKNIFDGIKQRHAVKILPKPYSTSVCYSNCANGIILAPSLDGLIKVFSIHASSPSSFTLMNTSIIRHHKTIVQSITENYIGSMFASGDAAGNIALWSWKHFPC